jgi:hypothetical protein
LLFRFSSFQSVRGQTVKLPPDGNNVTGRPVARGIEHAIAAGVCTPGKQQDIAFPLVISLRVEMLDVFARGTSVRALTEQNHLGHIRLSY